MKSLAAFLLTFATVALAAQPTAAQSPAATPTERILRVLAPRVRPLDRGLVTFHYENARATENIETQNQVLSHLRWVIHRFANSTIQSGDMVGLGLYVAIDPTSTRSFGGNNPWLFVVPLAAGARVLNVMDDGNADVADMQSLLAEMKCNPADKAVTSLEDVPGAFRNSTDTECRKVWIDALTTLRVDAVLYGYNASTLGLGCRSGRGEALSIVSDKALRETELALYTNDHVVASDRRAPYVAGLYRSGRLDFYERFAAESEDVNVPPATLKGLNVNIRALRSWTGREIYKCGPPRSTEGTSSELFAFAEQLIEAYRDAEVENAEITWVRAWRKKMSRHDSDTSILTRIHEIEHLQYEASGLAPDDSKLAQYQKAVDINENSSLADEEKAKQLSVALEEKIPNLLFSSGVVTLRQMIHQLGINHAFPGMFPLLMNRAGAGPRYTRLQTNQTLPSLGGMLLLTRELPLGNTPRDAALLAESKTVYLGILRKCTALYQDDRVTTDEIMRGSCGVRVREP